MTYNDNGYVSRVGYSQQFAAAGGGVDVWADLISGWHMEEASGNSRVDVLGANTLLEDVACGSETGKIGDGVIIPTGGSNLPKLHADSTDFNTPDFAVSLWFKVTGFWDPLNGKPLITKETANPGWLLAINATPSINVYEAPGGVAQVSVGFSGGSLGAWHHIAAYYDDTTETIRGAYDGGTPIEDSSGLNGNGRRKDSTRIRCEESVTACSLDEVYVFGAKKDDDWLSAMWNGGAGIAYPNQP
jgi:hypothetical protein